VSPRLQRIASWAGYPLFYFACLIAFSYVSIPWDRLKSAVAGGFNQTSPLQMQIGKLTWAWRFPGIVAKEVKLVGSSPGLDDKGKARPAPEYVVDDFFARISVLPLLWGTTKLGFSVDGFGGSIDGSTKTSADSRDLEVELEDVDAAKMPYVADLLGLPVMGTMSGKIELQLPQGKLTAAEGVIEFHIADFVLGDGKTKIRDTVALPKVKAGQFELKADVNEGTIKITNLSTKGTDLEVVSDGRIRLMDRFDASLAELNLRFKFADAYKNKDETTRSIFGTPGSLVPGLFDLDPKMKRAKRDDGFYAWHITGPLARLNFLPATADPADAAATRNRRTPLKGFAPPKAPTPPPAAPKPEGEEAADPAPDNPGQ
jgi:type II secretion system protein N